MELKQPETCCSSKSFEAVLYAFIFFGINHYQSCSLHNIYLWIRTWVFSNTRAVNKLWSSHNAASVQRTGESSTTKKVQSQYWLKTIGEPQGSKVHFPKCKSGLTWDTQASASPAAQKALLFTFKQQNNNQWSIINAEIIHVHSCVTLLSVKPLKSCSPIQWIALYVLHYMEGLYTYHSHMYWPEIYIYPKFITGLVLKSRFLCLITQRPYCLRWSWTINIEQILLRPSTPLYYLLSLHSS